MEILSSFLIGMGKIVWELTFGGINEVIPTTALTNLVFSFFGERRLNSPKGREKAIVLAALLNLAYRFFI